MSSTSTPPPINYPHPLEVPPTGALSHHDLCLRRFSATIRNKPNWTEKIKDRSLVAKWIREAALQDNEAFSEDTYVVPVWDVASIAFVTEELEKGYAPYVEKLRGEGAGGVEPDIDGVWRADWEEGVARELIDAVATLENVPEEQKDWHPGAGRQVLDLVHPSLWPVIYGKTVSTVDGKPIRYPQQADIPSNVRLESAKAEGGWDEYDYEDEDESDDEDEDEYEDAEGEESNEYQRRKNSKKVNKKLQEARSLNGWSSKYCWLPSVFEVSPDGKSTKIKSYINNLSTPEQKELFYPILERIFTKFVPLFNHVLADLARGRQTMHRTLDPDEFGWEGRDYHVAPLSLSVFKKKWEKFLRMYENGEDLSRVRGFKEYHYQQKGYHWNPGKDDDSDWYSSDESDDDDYGDEEEEEEEEEKEEDSMEQDNDEGGKGDATWQEYQPPDDADTNDENNTHENPPPKQENDEPYSFYEKAEVWDVGSIVPEAKWCPPEVTDQIRLEGKPAKVIVKMANILLTPEAPQYWGGSWHVEAMKNERIIATGIYYYAQENITESTLRFRRTAPVDRDPQWNSSYWSKLHSMGHWNGVQEIGGIETKENRAIVFPNIYQHSVYPFSLKDRTKPGYRKILVFFLCDPNHDVPTTETVMPQQPDQRIDLENSLREGPLGKLPEELFRGIVGDLPPLITLEEAHGHRAKLMEERSSFVGNSSRVQGRYYNLCEH
ncbi:hypothetical protein TWF718_010288 [Orbilia javanica]|uniref:Uncharacterized protein n=1 Tax=Orbilia javanica TaxID=47235 RepID=A0AAN8R9X8_9PEZI